MRKLVAALTVAALAVGAWLVLRPQSGAERVKGMIAWDPSCADVVISEKPTWPSAAEHATITCEMAGPLVEYARFDTGADLRKDLLANPPSAGVCIAGLEVTVDYLDGGQFEKLCRDLKGDRIDKTLAVPEPAYFGPQDDPQFDAWIRGMQRAQEQALRRFWHL
ncbi:hypothetical protein OM076_04660 [Solirubrobacter ginsenosidimutans]|uniref:Uncharacterized protein n=1 Tax=Solirubrobacter ginsenosidimutans TaxID=490573 RepID=A0A9X3MMX1_9ACTN|nr:hypothetical protein [Solirubrobacter ginsenosidimutans]MDA0159546.1 hypothetical protein [Solirubrobacter ginsenosidimutans]